MTRGGLDNLRYIRRTAGNCRAASGSGWTWTLRRSPRRAGQRQLDHQTAPALTGSRGMAAEDSETVHVKLYAGGAATGHRFKP